MKRMVAVVAALMIAPAALAYQVTGTVVEVTDAKIVVDKDGEKFDMARGKDTKGAAKKGDKVTVQYKMQATTVEVKKK